eukprot:CAMPEP_0119123196 /NCGR_PEP_ID=MMETSP1310-20130426/3216_1 /TAXON_ID=464262 /ORGANISM="Genus nov. species nov., Strain RCC2339" /LENGTH=401 /DNA_ID=CAMNT_0007112967 /DNA_START=69 /DNA_END=1277 /DNA_ORIENTATION=+
MADTEDIAVCLRPVEENGEAAEVQLPVGDFLLGRTVFCIKDKYCSRKQAAMTVTQAGKVTLTPRGTNPMQLKRKGEPEYSVLEKDVKVELKDGDFFTLYQKRHPYKVCVVSDQFVEGPQDLVPGICVWYKHPGYPYWPARIAKLEEVGPGIRNKKQDNTHLIYFFGTKDYLWVKLPNETTGRGRDEAKRPRKAVQGQDSERDISCGCLVWAVPDDEDAMAGRKRKRTGKQHFSYPVHIFSCKRRVRVKSGKGEEFSKAVDEVIDWTQTPSEEWHFPTFIPGEDSDEEEDAASSGGGQSSKKPADTKKEATTPAAESGGGSSGASNGVDGKAGTDVKAEGDTVELKPEQKVDVKPEQKVDAKQEDEPMPDASTEVPAGGANGTSKPVDESTDKVDGPPPSAT